MRKSPTLALVLLAGAAAFFAPPGAAADKTLTVTGTIARVQASERTVTVTLADGPETRFAWNADTKINGVLAPGARVTIRYDPGPDGKNLALQITVARS